MTDRQPTGSEMGDDAGVRQVDAFLARVPPDARAALEKLRGVIRSAAPDAGEIVAYGVPAFRYRGRPLVSYGAAKTHCSFYVQSPAVMEAHADALRGYKVSKGTVHFQPDAPLPADLVTTLVRARMAETDAAARQATRQPSSS